MTMRFLTAGAEAILVEVSDLSETLALLDHLQAQPLPGVKELVPAARTLLVRFDALQTSRQQLEAALGALRLGQGAARAGQTFEIPVTYNGEDLADVAELLGLSVAQTIRAHTEALYTVAFTGFAPGFAYMTSDDPRFDVPRRSSPRVRIPAGSVALAGTFGGIYPSDSPGGWQLLGRTPLQMWDLSRPRPALLAPGDRVLFRDMAKGATVPATAIPSPAPSATTPPDLTLLEALRPVLYQDLGREGQAAQGVARAGALDRRALRDVNRILGNDINAPALEISFGSVKLRAEGPLTLALTGATAPMRLLPASGGAAIPLPHQTSFAMDAGDQLIIGAPSSGVVSYLGLRGGFAVPPVLGSASRDTLAKVGPQPLSAGDGLTKGTQAQTAVQTLTPAPDLPKSGDIVDLDILLGPRDDWVTAQSVQDLTRQDWLVTTEISRTGLRLKGERPLEWRSATELPSEATVSGALQVPRMGQPVLFLADHPLTGGYPVVACIAPYHLDLAAQIPPGASIRFHPKTKGA